MGALQLLETNWVTGPEYTFHVLSAFLALPMSSSVQVQSWSFVSGFLSEEESGLMRFFFPLQEKTIPSRRAFFQANVLFALSVAIWHSLSLSLFFFKLPGTLPFPQAAYILCVHNP